LELRYRTGTSHPDEGHFAGGVEEPQHLDELAIGVSDREMFDFEKDIFVPTGDLQVQISGSRRAFYELGRYFVALSKLETEDPDYHDHFDGLRLSDDTRGCELIVRLRR
jgi:hypothetical protein